MCMPSVGDEDILVDVFIGATGDYAETVTLSTSADPAGVISDLSPSRVEPPDTALWTLTVDETVVGGDYSMLVSGEDDQATRAAEFSLRIDEPLLDAPTLLTPADGTQEAELQLEFGWSALPYAGAYRIQIAIDSGFDKLLLDETVTEPGFMLQHDLHIGTTYYWRVSGTGNACGDSAWSEVFDFTTRLEPVVMIAPPAFEFDVMAGDTYGDILTLHNAGTGNLLWSVATDLLETISSRTHDPSLNETLELPSFTLVSPANGGGPTTFNVPAGLFSRGRVTGFQLSGTVSGITGSPSWASDLCMILEAPNGRRYSVGGQHAVIQGCGVRGWEFQGSGSAGDGTYESMHDGAFGAGTVIDLGDWTMTFVNAWNSTEAATMTWSDVTVTLYKTDLPVCAGDTVDVPWMHISPNAGSTAAGQTDEVALLLDARNLAAGVHDTFLCVDTNDPNASQVVVPVTVTVTDHTEPPLDEVFHDRFEFTQ